MEHDQAKYEFDLASFAEAIIQKWRIVLATVVLCCIGAIVYSFLQTPVYRAEAIIKPPNLQDIESLSLARLGTGKISQADIYQSYKRVISSRETQYQFLLDTFKSQLPSGTEPNFKHTSADGFSKKTRDFLSMETDWIVPFSNTLDNTNDSSTNLQNIRINIDADKRSTRIHMVVSIDWVSPAESVDLLVGLIKFADRTTVDSLVAETMHGIETRKTNIESLIQYKRTLFQKEKDDRIAKLREAIDIAHKLNAKEPINSLTQTIVVEITPPASLYTKPVEKGLQPDHVLDIATYLPLYQVGNIAHFKNSIIESRKPPTYARGWNALEAELGALLYRKDDDPFIPDIRRLQQELVWLEHLEIDVGETRSINHTTPKLVSSTPVHPKTMFILLTTAFIGLVLGMFIALILQIRQNRNNALARDIC